MKKICLVIFWAYLLVLTLLQVLITHQTAMCNVQMDGKAKTNLLDHVVEHSDRYDRNCVLLRGNVSESGHPFFDCFFIKSYSLRVSDGRTIIIFSNSSTPIKGGRLLVNGEFRQFFHGFYFTWLGVIEWERAYLD